MFGYSILAFMLIANFYAHADSLGFETVNTSTFVYESKDDRYDIMGMIFKIHRFSVPPISDHRIGSSLSVFEVSGDTALNSNGIFVTICPDETDKPCAHFPFALAINSVLAVSLDVSQSLLIVEGYEDFISDSGDIESVRVVYALKFQFTTNGSVADRLTCYRVH